MELHLTWQEAAVRLALTLAAGGLLGLNRESLGHSAGLRTTMLVSLAAALAMMQAQALLDTGGKTPGSFSVMDVMRLPLGILSGMGFIGAGAILRRGNLVTGLTTAATLWVATVIGLLFGGGQLWLGIAGSLVAAAILWALKWINEILPRTQKATMTVRGPISTFDAETIGAVAWPLHYRLKLRDLEIEAERATARFLLRWRGAPHGGAPADLLERVSSISGIQAVNWVFRE